MKRLLLIEDNDDFRFLIKKVLEDEGYTVVEAENGKIAIRKFTEQTPDLVITDIVMPDKEGLELIKEMRLIDSQVKIIAMSGGGTNSQFDYLKLAEFFGADFVIDKPFEIPNFIDLVSKALE